MSEVITVGGLQIRQATDQELVDMANASEKGCKPFYLLNGGQLFFRDITGAYYGAHEDTRVGELVAIPPGALNAFGRVTLPEIPGPGQYLTDQETKP